MFNVKNAKAIEKLIEKSKLQTIKTSIIYRLLEKVTELMTDLIPVKYTEEIKGSATVLAIFDINVSYGDKIEKVAGSKVETGLISNSPSDLSFVRIMRNNKEVFRGKIKVMRHFKKEVTTVNKGMECGIIFENFRDFQIGDSIEYVEKVKLKQSL